MLLPTIPDITAALGGDRGLMEMGPYSAGDINTETVWVQRVIPLPYDYVSAFLSDEVTPRFYLETLYHQIVTDNHAVYCTALQFLPSELKCACKWNIFSVELFTFPPGTPQPHHT